VGKWGTETFGNFIFWVGMILGPVILTYAYTCEYFVAEAMAKTLENRGGREVGVGL